jgi:hypothetical protein
MSIQSANALDSRHPVRGETPAPAMAKATLPDVPKRENRTERQKKEAYGRILKAVQHVLGKNRDEMGQWLNVDPRQLGRWYAGDESPQMWRYHAIPTVRRALRLVEALDDVDGATVVTTITAKLDLGFER